MPCNIGYKSYSKVEIPEPQPQAFKAKADAPEIDADLLAKLGNEDPEFLEWISELDTNSLFKEALKRAKGCVAESERVEMVISQDGYIEMKSFYSSAGDKRNVKKITEELSDRFQMEVLGIVAQLLGYTVTITQNGSELVLEAEEEGKSHPCDYIKVAKKNRNATLVFEHFKSRGALQLETARFLTLAHKLGVKIAVGDSVTSEGDPFPGEERHSHKHGHHHDHDHDHDDES